MKTPPAVYQTALTLVFFTVFAWKMDVYQGELLVPLLGLGLLAVRWWLDRSSTPRTTGRSILARRPPWTPPWQRTALHRHSADGATPSATRVIPAPPWWQASHAVRLD